MKISQTDSIHALNEKWVFDTLNLSFMMLVTFFLIALKSLLGPYVFSAICFNVTLVAQRRVVSGVKSAPPNFRSGHVNPRQTKGNMTDSVLQGMEHVFIYV